MNVKKKAVLTLGGVSMAAALVGLGAAPASAALTYGKLQNTSTGYCLDGNADGNIYPKACNAGNYQQWAFELNGNTGYYQLKQRATLKCLDAYADGKVRLNSCNSGSYQEFEFSKNSLGGYQIWSRHWGKCLDMNSSPAIYLLKCNTGNYQRWHR
ncbi:RICIN domain-containing protein [Streptomyces sp. NPDC001930]|uniref:RICIN domain-containing protein n=1 Tax=Streptomyces sp. NPDC001930 TaxID=3364625 RepID=UPI003690D23E